MDDLLESMPSPAALVDREGVVVRANAAWRDAALTAPGERIALPELAALLEGRASELLHEHTVGDRSFRLMGRSTAAGALLQQIELPATKSMVDLLRHRLTAVVDSTPNVAIQAYGSDGRVLRWNPASERVYGWSASEAVGKSLDQLILTKEEAVEFVATLERIARTGETIPPFTTDVRRKDGRIGTVYSTLFRVPGERSEHEFICMDVDISDQRALEAQLLQAQKMEGIGRLAGGIAHDFNNVLTAIVGSAELVKLSLPREHPARDGVEHIVKATTRARDLTKQLLTFARKQAHAPRVVNLNKLLQGMEDMLRRSIGEDIELETVLWPVPAAVRVDPGHFEQLLVNLVVNARDAMPGGGRLTLRVTIVAGPPPGSALPRGRVVRLIVSDTGTGMTPEVLSHVFEPFFTTKAPGKGTGLGLATAYGVVRQSGGEIRAESAPGAGSTFVVDLPESLEAPTDEARPPVVVAPSRGGSETILVVEDEPLVRDLARRILSDAGYRILTAADPSEALRLSRAHDGEIHLLLTDVVMPVMGGRQLAERLRAERPGVKLLYMSGYSEESRTGIIHAGRHFLAKPFTPTELVARVRELLDELSS